MIVSEVQIACEYKKLFRRKVIVYLKLSLHTNGIWDISINTKYFSGKITKKLWRDIQKYCKEQIVSAQNRELAKIFKVGKMAKYSESTRFSKQSRMEVNYSDCVKYVDSYQIFMGAGQ